MGRPSSISQKQVQLICDLLVVGQSLTQICQIDGFPPKQTVLRWLRANPDFRAQYARARRWQARNYAEEIVEIADDTSQDVSGELGLPNPVAVNRAKLRIDARKWVAAKLLPKKYGDNQKVQTEHTGSIGLQLVHSIPQPVREDLDGSSPVAGHLGSGRDTD